MTTIFGAVPFREHDGIVREGVYAPWITDQEDIPTGAGEYRVQVYPHTIIHEYLHRLLMRARSISDVGDTMISIETRLRRRIKDRLTVVPVTLVHCLMIGGPLTEPKTGTSCEYAFWYEELRLRE